MSDPERERVISQLVAMLAELGWTPAPVHDAIDQRGGLDLLDSDEAGIVSGRGASTAARWAQAAEDAGAPIAIKVGSSWLFVAQRLLRYIERKFGLHARREAETRHQKLIEMRARPQHSTSNGSWRAAAAIEACDNESSRTASDTGQSVPASQPVETE